MNMITTYNSIVRMKKILLQKNLININILNFTLVLIDPSVYFCAKRVNGGFSAISKCTNIQSCGDFTDANSQGAK